MSGIKQANLRIDRDLANLIVRFRQRFGSGKTNMDLQYGICYAMRARLQHTKDMNGGQWEEMDDFNFPLGKREDHWLRERMETLNASLDLPTTLDKPKKRAVEVAERAAPEVYGFSDEDWARTCAEEEAQEHATEDPSLD